MTLIVEDGTGISNADTYVSISDHVAYAALYGITKTTTQAEIDLRKAMDFIEDPNKRYKGDKKYDSSINTLQFPRDNMRVNYSNIDYTTSLSMVSKLENEVALSIGNGVDPTAVQGRAIKTQTLGPLSQTFEDNASNTSYNPKIDMYLQPLLRFNSDSLVHFKVVTREDYPLYCGNIYDDFDF